MKVTRAKHIETCVGSLAILAFSLILIISVSAASATPVQLPFYESFDSYNVCTVDPGPWQYLYSGVSAHVSDDWARSGNKSLRVEGKPYWARMEYVKLGSLPDLLSYEATVYIDSETERTDAWVGFMFKHPDTPYPGGADENAFRFYRNGEIWWYGKEGTYLCHYSVGDTFRLRAQIDASTETADVYVYDLDDELLVYEADLPAWPHFIPKEAGLYSVDIILDQFGLSAGGYSSPGNTVVYVDDVLLTPEAAMIESTIDIDPDTLNLNIKGKWITCYIELPGDYEVDNIDVSTIKLNDQVPAESHPTGIGDEDDDGVPDLMVKFNREAVQEILQAGDEVEITVTGELEDETPFEGSDTIRVIDKGGNK